MDIIVRTMHEKMTNAKNYKKYVEDAKAMCKQETTNMSMIKSSDLNPSKQKERL